MIAASPFLLFLIIAGQATIPYKPANEYEVLIDFKFQDRPAPDRNNANYDFGTEEKKRTTSGPLPYLKLQIKLLTLGSDELKVKVINSNGNMVYNRKTALDTTIKLDLGFIDDVKDRITPHEFTVLFLSDSKASISQIHMIVMEDGTFLVNNEVKSKF